MSLARSRPSFFSSRGKRGLRDPSRRGSLPRLQLRSRSQWPLGPFSSLVIDQRSTLLPLIDGFRKNTRQSFEDTSLSLFIRQLGRRIGIGSALRRAVAKLLKHYAQSFVRLVEAACCSGFDCYVWYLRRVGLLWITAFGIKRAIRRFGALQTMGSFSNRACNCEIESLSLKHECVASGSKHKVRVVGP